MRVLIVEDHPINLRLLRAQLEGSGIEALEAADGAEALVVLGRERVDAIISDILMPRMDGYRLCYEVRSNPRWASLPFIFYTATYTTEEDEKAALNLGADAFLRKPTGAPQLVEVLHELKQRPRATAGANPPPDGVEMMKVYNERLVAKLEERNLALEKARDELRVANASLEERVSRRTEELEAAIEQLESFASFVSHELRGPVRAINGFAALLAEDHVNTLAPEGRRLLGVIERNAKQMAQLIDDLLGFALLGRAPVAKQSVSLREVVELVLQERQPDIDARQVQIVVGELPTLPGDPALLKIVFQNLIGNALKFTRQQPNPRIEIASQRRGSECVFYVRDNGVGFDMEHAGKLFTPFERLHTRDRFEGTGIGLGMVRNIIQRHGGRVWAEAAVNEGATFFFTLEEGGS